MDIQHEAQAGGSRAWTLVVEGHFWLSNDGLAAHAGGLPTGWDDELLCTWVGEEPIGVLTYRVVKADREAVVTLLYVEPSSRHTGVAKALLAALVARATQARLRRVVCEAHVDNAAFVKLLEVVGAKPLARLFALEIPSG
jgi:ribosomal protein S18 acetylase RimI-like enzyme